MKGSVMAHREAYYVDYAADFGLSGLAETVCRRAAFRVDEPTVATLAARAALDEDDQLGRDVRLLLESPLSDEALQAVWLAATRRGFDPAENGLDTRAWLRRVLTVCPPLPPPLRPSPADAEGGSTVTEEELRDAVTAELRLLAPALATAIPVPDLAHALERVVREADADLGLRLLLRAVKAYSVRVSHDQYHSFLRLGDQLDYPLTAVFEGLSVRWPPLDTIGRNFVYGFGLPALSRQFDAEWDAWRYEGTGEPREHVVRFVHADSGLVPGAQAAALMEDVTILLDSPLTDEQITAVWRTASRRRRASEEFDADVRTWLRQIAEVCREHLVVVDPAYTPRPRSVRTDLAHVVLSELRVIAPILEATGDAVVREGVQALEQVMTEADPDLGFRILLRFVDGYDITVTGAQYARYERLGELFGCGAGYVRRELEPPVIP
ncbi:hypothetical protein ACWCQK_26170 [Streptomyces sp. NPDC002306]